MSEIDNVKEAGPVQVVVVPTNAPTRKAPRKELAIKAARKSTPSGVVKKAPISESSTDAVDYDALIQYYRVDIDILHAANVALVAKIKNQEALLQYYREDIEILRSTR